MNTSIRFLLSILLLTFFFIDSRPGLSGFYDIYRGHGITVRFSTIVLSSAGDGEERGWGPDQMGNNLPMVDL